MTVIVKKLGGSMAIVIPKGLASEMGFKVGQALEVSQQNDSMLLRKQSRRTRRPLRHIIREIDAAAYGRHARAMTDKAVGREVW